MNYTIRKKQTLILHVPTFKWLGWDKVVTQCTGKGSRIPQKTWPTSLPL